MSGSSRVVLDSDDEDELDEELGISNGLEPTASNGASEATISGTTSISDHSTLHDSKDNPSHGISDDVQGKKRAALDSADSERDRLKRPKVVPEPQSRQYHDDPYEGSQVASQQQPTESQLREMYHEVIAEPSSTVMDSATPRPVPLEDDGNVEPADLRLGDGDITFHEEDASMTPTKACMTPTTSTSQQTSWNNNTMRVPVVLIPGPPQGYTKTTKPRAHREPSPDELSSDRLSALPKEMYRPRPSRSRSLHRENGPDEGHNQGEVNSKRNRRGASAGATMQQRQESLVGMGFRASQAELALEATGGSLDQAVEWLCPEQTDEPTNATSIDTRGENEPQDEMENTSEAVSTSARVEPEPDMEPEYELSTKKRKAASKKKTPVKKKQRKKPSAEDIEMHQAHATIDESTDPTTKQEEQASVHDDLEDEQRAKQSVRKGRSREKRAAAQIDAFEEPDDELAEAIVEKDNVTEGSTLSKESPPPKAAKRGRGRPKKVPAPVDISIERDEEVEEPKESAEPTAEAAPTEVMAEADVAGQSTEAGSQETKVLVEKDANASAVGSETVRPDDEPKLETLASVTKKPLGEENLVRATPPLKLNSGPVHRVGLSRRRPIQSLLRIIKR